MTLTFCFYMHKIRILLVMKFIKNECSSLMRTNWFSLCSLRCDDQRYLERFMVDRTTNPSVIAYPTNVSVQGISTNPLDLSLLQRNSFLLEKLESLKGEKTLTSMQPTSLLLAKENSSKVNKPLATDLWSSHEEYKKVSFVASRAESKEHELKRLICLVQSLGSLTKLRKGSSNTQRDLDRLNLFLENQLKGTLSDEVSFESGNLQNNDKDEEKADEVHPPSEKNVGVI